MSRLAGRVQRLERHTLRGTCPHRPPLVVHVGDWHPSRRHAARDVPCWCGRPRLVLTVRYDAHWHAQDVDDTPDAEPEAEA